MKHFYAFILALAAVIPAPALAQENLLSGGIGWYDILDDEGAADFRLEYRSGDKIFWEFQPWGGFEVTSDASIWAGGGILLDFALGENYYVSPSFGVGLYDEGDSDLDLDFPIEFRSQIEAGYKMDSGHRIGVAFGHISNASLGDDNPGTEILNVYYHVPIAGLFN